MQRAVPFLRSRRYLRGWPVHGTESASFCYSLKSPGTFQLKRSGLLLPSSWEAKDEVLGELSATLKLSLLRHQNFSGDRLLRPELLNTPFGLESRKAWWYLHRVRSRRQQVRAKGQAHCPIRSL